MVFTQNLEEELCVSDHPHREQDTTQRYPAGPIKVKDTHLVAEITAGVTVQGGYVTTGRRAKGPKGPDDVGLALILGRRAERVREVWNQLCAFINTRGSRKPETSAHASHMTPESI